MVVIDTRLIKSLNSFQNGKHTQLFTNKRQMKNIYWINLLFQMVILLKLFRLKLNIVTLWFESIYVSACKSRQFIKRIVNLLESFAYVSHFKWLMHIWYVCCISTRYYQIALQKSKFFRLESNLNIKQKFHSSKNVHCKFNSMYSFRFYCCFFNVFAYFFTHRVSQNPKIQMTISLIHFRNVL